MKQTHLFPNDNQSIKDHHLKRLRELREEFKELGRQRAERRRLLDNARKQEDWEDLKRACYTIKR